MAGIDQHTYLDSFNK